MDRMNLPKQITDFIRKYRYFILVFLIGIVLMTLPSRENHTEESSEPVLTVATENSIDADLEAILSQVEGAGKVQVMLTIAAGEETVFQTDGNAKSETSSTVIITDGERNQVGLIRQINPPNYLGAVIVCQGADSPAVRLAIVDAVSKITGLGADRISVLKMK